MRTIVWFLYFWVSLVGLLPFRLRAKLLQQGDPLRHQRFVERVIGWWAASVLRLAGVTVTVTGSENIPDEPVVFVANHQGYFDIPVLLTSLGRPYPLVAKRELQKMPLVRGWMEQLGCVFLDRDNARQAVTALNAAIETVKSGRSMIIFPEGTRSKGKGLGEFKSGAFRIAQKSERCLLPVVIDGTWRALEQNKGRIQPAQVSVRILPPISVSEIPKEEQKQIPQMLSQLFLQNLCVDSNAQIE